MTERGHASSEGIFFLIWMSLYGYTGYLVGAGVGHPTVGVVLGLLTGFYPSAQMGIGAHYGGLPAFLCIPAILVFPMVSNNARLWLGICICSLPWLLLIPHLVSVTRTAIQSRLRKHNTR